MNYYLPYYDRKKDTYYLYDEDKKINEEVFSLIKGFDDCFYISFYYSFNFKRDDGSLKSAHTHDFESLIYYIYNNPQSIVFTKEDLKFLSKQEIDYIDTLKNIFLSLGITDYKMSHKRELIQKKMDILYEKKTFFSKILYNLYSIKEIKEIKKERLRYATGCEKPKYNSKLLIPYFDYKRWDYVIFNEKEKKKERYKNKLYAIQNMFSLKFDYTYEYEIKSGEKTIKTLHQFEEVINELYLYPESFNIPKAYKNEYSKQELEYLNALQKRLLQCKLKDYKLPFSLIIKTSNENGKKTIKAIRKYQDEDMLHRATHENIYLKEFKKSE